MAVLVDNAADDKLISDILFTANNTL